jgi:peptidyl-prolyl cis-trans isomerase D
MFNLFRSRDKAVRILLGAILLVVCLSMVTYLIPNQGQAGFSAGDENVLAKVGDQKITTMAALQAITNAMQGRNLPPEIRGFYAPQVVEQLINEQAMAYEARRLGIQVSDDDVLANIRSQLPPNSPTSKFFKDDGTIDQDMFTAALAQHNMSVQDFIDQTRQQLYVERLRQVILDSVVVTKSDVEQEFKRRGEKVQVDYVVVKPALFEAQVQVTPAEVEANYKNTKVIYNTPEKKSLAIVLINTSNLESTINPTDAELLSVYNQSLDRFRSPEQVKVRHILLKTDPTKKDDAAKKDDAQVQARAEDLLKQLKGGADFADLATKYSEDPGSKAKGGDVGFIARGQMVKPFEDAAFSLQPGQMSGLVKTTYGYHILKVEARENAHVKPFAEVKDVLTGEFRKRKAAEMAQQLSDTATADLKKDPAHPEKAAEDAKGELVRADNVKAGEPLPKIGVNQQFQTALNGLKQGGVSQPVNITPVEIAIGLVTGITPSHPSPLDEVRPQVEAAVRKDKIQDLLQKKVAELMAKTKADGNDLAKAAKELGLEMKESNSFDRQGAIEGLGSAASLAEAFTAKDGSIVGPVAVADGKAVVKVISHTPADMSGFAAQQSAIREELKQKQSRERFALFEEGLRKRLEKDGKVTVHTDALNKFVQGMRS